MKAKDSEFFEFDLCGGRLAIDFANTLSWRTTPEPIERISSYGRLIWFGLQSRAVSEPEAERLRAWANAHPDEAREIVAGAVELREALYSIFSALAEDRAIDPEALRTANRFVARLGLDLDLGLSWASGADAPDALLGKIIRSALEILTTEQKMRVRICAADDCAWLFFDSSKNQSRRWCDMTACGNRQKARRFHERQKQA